MFYLSILRLLNSDFLGYVSQLRRENHVFDNSCFIDFPHKSCTTVSRPQIPDLAGVIKSKPSK